MRVNIVKWRYISLYIIIYTYQLYKLYTLSLCLFFYLSVEDVLAHNWRGIKITLEALCRCYYDKQVKSRRGGDYILRIP